LEWILIRALIDLYILLIIVDSILGYLPQFRFRTWAIQIRRMADFTCAPIRRYLPGDLPFDFSPLVVIIGLKLIQVLW
jgi:YggT family protein